MTELAADLAADDITFTVDPTDLRSIARGVVEIDDELLLVRSYDTTSGVVTVMGGARGRGYAGTTAAPHAAGSLVTTAPAYARQVVKDALADTVMTLYPDLVVFGETEIVKTSVVWEYEMPSEAEDVWYVTGSTIGPTRVWMPLQNWRFNPDAATSAFPSGKSIQLLDEIVPGRTYRVVYAKRPQLLVSGADDWSLTGYPDSVAEVAVWGACARLVTTYEAARLQQRAVESVERSKIVGPQSALRTAAYYQELYAQALEREKARQFSEMPSYQNYQGS
ncbi:hypothetical protein [Streptomyces hoynatensis]|uniref:phage adaptor protein n=1 Tax=Streptomyces hoynatensis TaxID=1141874 RepID=UPI0011C42861|nr:hypothetical protein [Streptomyces hoynatensis]